MLTRTFTNSHFDHIAMLLKFESDENEIYLVDATGNCGVCLNKWENLKGDIGDDQFYSKVIYRHINFDRNDKMVDNLEQFLQEAIGQKYGLSPNKLLRSESVSKTIGVDREVIDS
jgi:hypothetical protein